jgi:NADH dehydrogenase
VTYPLRMLFGAAPNVSVLLARVTGFDLDHRRVRLADDARPGAPESLEYDTLVVAAGSSYACFGHEEWRRVAGEVKSLESAISVRSRVLGAFERAEATTSACRPRDRGA